MASARDAAQQYEALKAADGPYYDLTYKVRGKSVAMRLTEAQAKRCEEWLRNHRQLRRIVHQMTTLSLKETTRLLRALTDEHSGK